MILRDYQRAISDAVINDWQDRNCTLVVAPTGCGKTIIFADVIRRSTPKRALVIAHREELILQAQDKIQRSTGLQCEIEMADQRANTSGGIFGKAPVVISTIQTQTAGGDGGGRMGKFDPADFGLLIIDEAHHATSPSYRRLIEYYRNNPELKVLGVTATPDRTDEEALGQVFESVAFDYEILDAIHDGWLVPVEQQMVNVADLDFSNISTTAGDLNGGELAAVMEHEKNLHGLATATIEIIGDKRTLIFTSSIRHAERLAEIFNRHRSTMAGWVCGKTDREERRNILARFARGDLQVVCNCAVLTEGFDDPGVEIVVMGRPTKSRALYSQMIGRCTRPLAGVVDGPETADARKAAIAASPKPSCLVVDFVGNSGRHKLISAYDVLGGKVSDDIVEDVAAKAKIHGRRMAVVDALDAAQKEKQELLKRLREEREEQQKIESERRQHLLPTTVEWTARPVDPFDVLQIQPVVSRGWDRNRSLSQKQRNLLIKHMGIDPDQFPYAQGKQLLQELFHRWSDNLCTFKQAKLLRKFGYRTNVTLPEARVIIDRIAAAGWKRPARPPVPTKPPEPAPF